jgi:hypothetical protein
MQPKKPVSLASPRKESVRERLGVKETDSERDAHIHTQIDLDVDDRIPYVAVFGACCAKVPISRRILRAILA